MTTPAAGEPVTARDLFHRLGLLLADLTSHASAGVVHADIVERLSEPDHDPRLDGVADAEEFSVAWRALGSGSSVPSQAWPTVVLPAVVAFSSHQDRKAHLELATSLWMMASTATGGSPPRLADADAGALPEPEPAPESLDTVEPSSAQPWYQPEPQPSVVDIRDTLPGPAPDRPRRRALLWATIATLLTTATLLWWTQAHRTGGGEQLSAPPGLPAGGGQLEPPTSPAAPPAATIEPGLRAPFGGPTPTPLSTLPAPPPTWSGPGPVTAPTAPQNLTVVGATPNSIALRWQPPADAGTGGLAYYRISRDGADAGWTAQSSATVTGLRPATSYTFTVTAYNGAGVASPPADPVLASTSPLLSPQPTEPNTTPPAPQTPRGEAPVSPALATDPARTSIPFGQSFAVTGAGWPCSAPATINVYLGGRLVARPSTNSEGAFRTAIAVDATNPAAPTVPVIGGSEPLTLTRGSWTLSAQLSAQASCWATANQSIQIVFR